MNTNEAGKLLGPIARPQTIADEVAERLVLAIANGEQEPGSRLTEGGVAEIMHVSRVPAREALQNLEQKGILVPAGQRGLRVVDFSEERIREVKEVRYALETMGMLKARQRLASVPEAVAPVDAILEEMVLLSERPNAMAQAQCDIRFHRELMLLSGNDLLVRTWDGLSPHLLILFCQDWHLNPNRVGEVALHRLFRDTVAHGGEKTIAEVLQTHIAVDVPFRAAR